MKRIEACEIDQKQVKTNQLEANLIKILQQEKTPTIVLHAEKSVPVENVVKVNGGSANTITIKQGS